MSVFRRGLSNKCHLNCYVNAVVFVFFASKRCAAAYEEVRKDMGALSPELTTFIVLIEQWKGMKARGSGSKEENKMERSTENAFADSMREAAYAIMKKKLQHVTEGKNYSLMFHVDRNL